MMIVRLALRNALRSKARSALTAATVLLGTALLTAGLAWLDGVTADMLGAASDSYGHVRIVTPGYATREELLPLHENLPDVAALSDVIRGVPGVVEVVPKITTGVTVTVGEEIGDVFALATGAPDTWLGARFGLAERLSGRLPAREKGELMLGATTARQLGAKLGDEVVLLGRTRDGSLSPIKGELVGIVDAGSGLVDQAAYVPLPAMQYLADLDGGATELLVYGEDRDDAIALAERLRAVPELQGLEIQPWSLRDPWAGLLPMIGAISGILQAAIVFVSALGVWNTMLMSVLERTDEIGVLRALGMERWGTVALFVIEALAIATVGGAAGVAVGSALAWWLEVHGVSFGSQVSQNMAMPISETMYADLTPRVALTAFALGWCVALLGSLLPALRAASIEPVEAMRQTG